MIVRACISSCLLITQFPAASGHIVSASLPGSLVQMLALLHCPWIDLVVCLAAHLHASACTAFVIFLWYATKGFPKVKVGHVHRATWSSYCNSLSVLFGSKAAASIISLHLKVLAFWNYGRCEKKGFKWIKIRSLNRDIIHPTPTLEESHTL